VCGARETKGREGQHTDIFVRKFIRKTHLKYVNVGGKIIIKYTLKKQEGQLAVIRPV
jgi:hypothetical protein